MTTPESNIKPGSEVVASEFQERLVSMASLMFDLLREWVEEELTPRTDLHDRTEAALRMIVKGPERIAAEIVLKAFKDQP